MSLHVQNHQLHPKSSRHITTAGKVFESVTDVIIPVTLDLFRSEQSPRCLKVKRAFLQSKNTQKRSLENKEEDIMSRKNGSSQKLDLRLNLSPPPSSGDSPPTPSRSASSVSPLSSCVSSEEEGDTSGGGSMVLVGCPRCLMYVMLSEHDPKCPKCKSDVLLDFVGNNNNKHNSVGSSKKTKKN